jgi:hypothetical protein
MHKALASTISLLIILTMAGCQAENVQPAASTQAVQNIPQTPYTKGPTSPPAVRGPDKPLPDANGVSVPAPSDEQPQAMTEKEDQKFTLNSN